MDTKEPNLNLLVAIKTARIDQRTFAALVGDSEALISFYVNGHRKPDERRKLIYSRILKRNPEEIFPD